MICNRDTIKYHIISIIKDYIIILILNILIYLNTIPVIPEKHLQGRHLVTFSWNGILLRN